MADVVFRLSDGFEPVQTPWGANLRLPMPVTVPEPEGPDRPARVRVRLGLTCDEALLCWASPALEEHGLELEPASRVFGPGEEIEAVLASRRNMRPVTLPPGTAVLRAHALVRTWQVSSKRG